jgi:hypothetical protein
MTPPGFVTQELCQEPNTPWNLPSTETPMTVFCVADNDEFLLRLRSKILMGILLLDVAGVDFAVIAIVPPLLDNVRLESRCGL